MPDKPPSDPQGLATGAALAVEAAPPAPWARPDGQASLFGLEVEEPDGIGELSPPPDDGARGKGKGRPAGSRNRATEEWRNFLLSRYRSPLVVLAEIAQAHPVALAQELSEPGEDGAQVEPLEALRLIVSAAGTLAPYIHQRQPLAVEGEGGALMQVIINGASAAQLGAVIGDAVQPVDESHIYQYLSEPSDDGSEPEGGSE